MDLQQVVSYCSAKPAAAKEFPFDDETLVFKLGTKMFALIILTEPHRINLKCDPVLAIELRQQFTSVNPGYHMNKKHWNTVSLDDSIPDKLLKQWIDNSYQLILNGLSNKDKSRLILTADDWSE